MTISCYCGHVYTTSADKAPCPRCGIVATLGSSVRPAPQRVHGSLRRRGIRRLMVVAEATRQYQATLEAHRAAWDEANADEAEEMDAELARVRRTMEVAWLSEHA